MNKKLLFKTRAFFKRNSSTMLTCAGAVGVVATAVLAVKATPRALKLLEEAKAEKEDDLTKFEVVKAAAPVYIPAVLVGAATITCVFGANVLNKRQQAALMSGYALLDRSYKEYKKKVEDLYGEEVDVHIRKEIAKDKYELTDITVNTDDDKILFYDEYSERYFEATMNDVTLAQYRLNQTLFKRGYAYVNEFYETLDLEPIDNGWDFGWSPGGNYEHAWQEWIDFNHHKVVMDDGLECIIISFYVHPTPNFMDFE